VAGGDDVLTALGQQVVASPHDDAPRLAYADAVAAEDPERSEFIRLQVVLAQRRRARLTGPDEPMGGHLREFALISSHSAQWADDVSSLVAGWQFFRGFVEIAYLDAAAFLAGAPELYRRAPILGLILTRVAPVAAELFASPYLRRIRSLSMVGEFRGDNLGDAEAIALASSPQLAELEWLDLRNNCIGAAGLEALAAAETLPRLGYLGFSGNAVDDPTPRFADEYDADSIAATQFQRTYGPRAWLSAHPRQTWPPPRDAVW
jgi:uncharacterized protein (TIGR02996 family)